MVAIKRRPRRCVETKEIAKSVFDYRRDNGLTQVALADQLKLSQQTISRLESGRPVNVRTFAAIRRAMAANA